MIRLHKDDGNEILLNEQLIKNIQRFEDKTIIILNDDSKITIKNTLKDIITKIKAAEYGINQD